MTSSIDESYVDVAQVGSPGRPTWALLPKILALVLVLAVIGWGVISAFALNTFERTLLPELHLKAATVGRSLVSQMGRALDHGVPPESLIGMQEFLNSALMVNPEVSYLVVANEGGRVLFSQGVGVDEAIQRIVFFKMPEDIEAGSFQTFEMGNFYDTSVPIIVRGELIGYMHVGVQRDFLRTQLSRVVNDLVMLLIASSVMGYYLIGLFLRFRLDIPIAAVRKGMFIGAVRDFRVRVQTAAADDALRVTRTFNLATRRLSEAYQRLQEEAEESKAAQIDPAVIARIDDAVLGFERRFRGTAVDNRIVLTDDVPMRGFFPLLLLICAAALVLFYQSDGQFIAVSNASFMGPAALALLVLLLPGARNAYRMAFQPGITLAAIGLVCATFDVGFMGTAGWNVIAGLGCGLAGGATLLGMSSESTWDGRSAYGPALLGSIFFAVTVYAVTSGAGHVATDWLVALLGLGAVLLAWSIGWPNPVSTVGLQIGERPDDVDPAESPRLRHSVVATFLTFCWAAGVSAVLVGLLPTVGGERGMLDHHTALFGFFFLTWAGVAFVLARRGNLMPLRLLAVIGGLCAALGTAQLGLAASGVDGIPKLASFMIQGLPGGAAWLGFAAFALGQAISLGPVGMILISATDEGTWLPDRLRRWTILLIAATIGFCVGPLVVQSLVGYASMAFAAWIAAALAGVGALLVLALPVYKRRPEPIMIDTMWR